MYNKVLQYVKIKPTVILLSHDLQMRNTSRAWLGAFSVPRGIDWWWSAGIWSDLAVWRQSCSHVWCLGGVTRRLCLAGYFSLSAVSGPLCVVSRGRCWSFPMLVQGFMSPHWKLLILKARTGNGRVSGPLLGSSHRPVHIHSRGGKIYPSPPWEECQWLCDDL